MRSFTYLFKDIPALNDYLNSTDILDNAAASRSILIQIFSSLTDKEMFDSITDTLLKVMPDAVIVGSTSVGEIMYGLLQVGTTVLSISFFSETALHVTQIDKPAGNEKSAGENLIRSIV